MSIQADPLIYFHIASRSFTLLRFLRSRNIGGIMIHKTVALLFASSLVSVALVAPAQALQPTAPRFASCESLLEDYPNGIARNNKARNQIVTQGFERPQVRKKIYKKNRKRLDRNRNGVLCEQATPEPVAPPSVANLSMSPPNPESAWMYDRGVYTYVFQLPEAAISQLAEIRITGTNDRTIIPSEPRFKTCQQEICTFTVGLDTAPWASTASVNVVTVGINGLVSEPATMSLLMPNRAKSTNTWTFIASGSRTAVPNSSGGDDWADGNQARTLELSRTIDRWDLLSYSAYASNYRGTASCEILKDGVRIDYERSTNGSAYCSARG